MLKEPLIQNIEMDSANGNTGQRSIFSLDSSTKSAVLESWKHDKRTKICGCCQSVLLIIVTFCAAIFELNKWGNSETNSISRSAIELVPYYDLPYFFFAAGDELWSFEVLSIGIYNSSSDMYQQHSLNRINNINDFQYDKSLTSWSIVYFFGWQFILIPPYHGTLNKGDFLEIDLLSYHPLLNDSYPMQSTSDNITRRRRRRLQQQYDVGNELLNELFSGGSYGIFWEIGSIGDLDLKAINDTYDRNDTHYAFISSKEAIQLSLYEERNALNSDTTIGKLLKVEPTSKYFYDSKLSASIYEDSLTNKTNKILTDFNNINDLSNNTISYCYEYQNQFSFYMSNKGGGIKDVTTTSPLISISDVFSKIGGIFSPSLTILTTLFGILLSMTCCGCAGIANHRGYSDDDKLKIALYLQELGVLTHQQYINSINFKKQNK